MELGENLNEESIKLLGCFLRMNKKGRFLLLTAAESYEKSFPEKASAKIIKLPVTGSHHAGVTGVRRR